MSQDISPTWIVLLESIFRIIQVLLLIFAMSQESIMVRFSMSVSDHNNKSLQIPAFFENLIPRPVGSFSSSGSSTLKRILFLIRFSVNPVFQSSILNFSCSKTAFFIHAYSRATFNRAKNINSRAAQNCSKSVPMGILWWHLRRFLVTTFPAMLRFF